MLLARRFSSSFPALLAVAPVGLDRLLSTAPGPDRPLPPPAGAALALGSRAQFRSAPVPASHGGGGEAGGEEQGLPSRPVRPNRRSPVPVYRSGLAGNRRNQSNSNLNSKAAVQSVRTGLPAGLTGLPVGLTGNWSV